MLSESYKRPCFDTFFYPILGSGKEMLQGIYNHQDTYYTLKQRGAKQPTPKAFVTNFKEYVQIILFDHELIKQFYLQQDKYIKLPDVVDLLKLAMQDGTLLSEGPAWKKHRKLTSSVFNYEYLQEIIPEVVKISEELLSQLEKKGLFSVNFTSEIQMITGEVIGRLFFGEKLNGLKFEEMPVTSYLSKLMAKIMIEQSSLFSFLLSSKLVKYGLISRHRELMKDIKGFRGFLENIVKKQFQEFESKETERLDIESRVSLLHLFYKQRVKNKDDCFKIEEIIDEFMTFFVAGMETTAQLITIMSYEFQKNPHCQKKLLDEIDKFFVNPSKITIETLNEMEYMEAMIKESLRITPPVPTLFMRKTIQTHTLGDIKLKPGTLVNVGLITCNYNENYHNEPYKFSPERWLDEDSQTRKSIKELPYAFLPFSAGSRNCLGQHLAMNEAKIIFCLFLKKFSFKLSHHYKMVYIRRFLYEPQHSLHYSLSLRNQS